jgi:hypothetical protein
MTLGLALLASAGGSIVGAALGTFAVLAVFSTPGLVAWRWNIVFNTTIRTQAWCVAAVLLSAGLVAQWAVSSGVLRVGVRRHSV